MHTPVTQERCDRQEAEKGGRQKVRRGGPPHEEMNQCQRLAERQREQVTPPSSSHHFGDRPCEAKDGGSEQSQFDGTRSIDAVVEPTQKGQIEQSCNGREMLKEIQAQVAERKTRMLRLAQKDEVVLKEVEVSCEPSGCADADRQHAQHGEAVSIPDYECSC